MCVAWGTLARNTGQRLILELRWLVPYCAAIAAVEAFLCLGFEGPIVLKMRLLALALHALASNGGSVGSFKSSPRESARALGRFNPPDPSPLPQPHFFFFFLVLTHLPLEECLPLEHFTVLTTGFLTTGATTSGVEAKFPAPVNV
jgi:hypothetical protein